MGRPMKSTRMRSSASLERGSNTIQVTAYFPVGSSLQTDADSYIMRQRGSTQFKIHQGSDSSEAIYTLTAVAPASLTAGKFCVQVILDDSTVAYVNKFYNRTVHYVTAAGAAGTCTYTLGVEGTDEGQAGAGIGSINVR